MIRNRRWVAIVPRVRSRAASATWSGCPGRSGRLWMKRAPRSSSSILQAGPPTLETTGTRARCFAAWAGSYRQTVAATSGEQPFWAAALVLQDVAATSMSPVTLSVRRPQHPLDDWRPSGELDDARVSVGAGADATARHQGEAQGQLGERDRAHHPDRIGHGSCARMRLRRHRALSHRALTTSSRGGGSLLTPLRK